MSSASTAALYQLLLMLFYNLRQHNFSLGVGEFILALKALSYGFGTESRQDFLFVCQTLWGKSREEQDELQKVLDAILAQQAFEEVQPSAKDQTGADPKPGSLKTMTPSVGEAGGPALQHAISLAMQGHIKPGPAGAGPVVKIPQVKPIQLNPALDLVGSLPIRKRHMKRSWRYYRRMQRSGAQMELDIAATVNQVAQRGRLVSPVMVPRRSNQAQILFLIDEGGSMVPFRRLIRILLKSVKQGGLSRHAAYYFHDVPKQTLYNDPDLNHGQPMLETLSRYHDSGILIVSDGGAARGHLDHHRLAQTARFIEILRRVTPHLAWLNPTPQSRWQGTTAGAIVESFRIEMFTLNRSGLDDAVDILRGKAF